MLHNVWLWKHKEWGVRVAHQSSSIAG